MSEGFVGLYVWNGSLEGQDARNVLNEYLAETDVVQTVLLSTDSGLR
jgi:hypothetical protein